MEGTSDQNASTQQIQQQPTDPAASGQQQQQAIDYSQYSQYYQYPYYDYSAYAASAVPTTAGTQSDVNASATATNGATAATAVDYSAYSSYYGYDYSQQAAAASGQQVMDYSQYSAYGTPVASAWGASTDYQQSAYGYGGAQTSSASSSSSSSSSRPQNQPSRTIWVGGVHPDTTEADIRAIFGPYGMITNLRVVTHIQCAFVTYVDEDAAMTAYNNTQRVTCLGQTLRVGWGKTEQVSAPISSLNTNPPNKNIWIGNITPDISEDVLHSHFGRFGPIDTVKILHQKKCAFINFMSVEAAVNARTEMNNKTLTVLPLRINFGKEGAGGQRSGNPNFIGGASNSYNAYGSSSGGGGGFSQSSESDSRDQGRVSVSNLPHWMSNANALPAPSNPASKPTPPEFALPPSDEEEKAVIDKLINYMAKNGEQFAEKVKKDARRSPKLAFLFEDSPSYPYYRWKAYCVKYNLDADVNPIPQLSSDERRELEDILAGLTGSKESIHGGNHWITERMQFSSNIIDVVEQSLQRFNTNPDKKTYIIYLLNAVLLQSSKTRPTPAEMDPFAQSLLPRLADILHIACMNQETSSSDKIMQILGLWERNLVFTESDAAAVKSKIQQLNVTNNANQYQSNPPTNHHHEDYQYNQNNDHNNDHNNNQQYQGDPSSYATEERSLTSSSSYRRSDRSESPRRYDRDNVDEAGSGTHRRRRHQDRSRSKSRSRSPSPRSSRYASRRGREERD